MSPRVCARAGRVWARTLARLCVRCLSARTAGGGVTAATASEKRKAHQKPRAQRGRPRSRGRDQCTQRTM